VGQKVHPNGNYAIFAIRPHKSVPKYIHETIDVLNQLNFNVIIVTNKPLLDSDHTALAARTSAILTRNGRGRDFGGFKDALLYLREHDAPRNILLLNDSVYYVARFLLPALRELTSCPGFAALTEVYEIHYHAQANCLFFANDAIKDHRFQRFWERYLPVSTRTYAIHNGEVAITKEMLKAGFSPAVTFNRDRLVRALGSLAFDELVATWRLFPNEAASEMKTALTDLKKSRFCALAPVAPGTPRGDTPVLYQASGRPLNNWSAASVERYYTEEARRVVIEKIDQLMDDRNALHVCGLLLTKYTKLPVIKRDMVFRNLYRQSTLEAFINEIAPELLPYVLEDSRLKGNSKYFRFIKRILYRYNIV
jgi:hypothetical protein